MGLMDVLVKIASSNIARKGNAPGDAVIVQAEATKGDVLTAELYQQPGLYSAPPKDARGVFVPLGGSRRYGVIIATHNYELNIQVNEGETTIYSTTPDGKTIKARIDLKSSGAINITPAAGQNVTLANGTQICNNLPTCLLTGAPHGTNPSVKV